MKYIFGPVLSRRLGKSLGIDPIALKTCNWNCVYCQLGRTRPLTNERQEYIPRHEIIAEFQRSLAAHQPGEIDWVTFVGSGEPTLHIGLGWLIRQVKRATQLPVAVITNGSLLHLPEVRAELMDADAVLPSLDAGNAALYRKINRPWPKLTFDLHLRGLAAFRQEYRGQLWLEVMLIKGLNDTEQAIQELLAAIKTFAPDQVHLLLPTRPPAESWVTPSDAEGQMRAQALMVAALGQNLRLFPPTQAELDSNPGGNLEDALMAIIIRHPLCEADLAAFFGVEQAEAALAALEKLCQRGQAQVVQRYGLRFWSAAKSLYEAGR